MQNYLSEEIESADLNAQYDAHVRRILKDKNVLAYILIYSVEEFEGYTFEEAKAAIEGEPEVAARSVRPKKQSPDAVNGQSNESKLPGEGSITFDIVFFVRTKSAEKRKLYINIEAQKSFYPGYDLTTRGVIYGARLLSEQMDVEYTADDYDGAKKVYSIWICMNTPNETKQHEDVADTIVEYAMNPKVIYAPGEKENVKTGRYDLLSVVMICLNNESTDSENKLIGMLSTLLSSKLSKEEKKSVLETEYKLPMTAEMESEASIMCNLSYAISEEAERKGIEKGIKKEIFRSVQDGDYGTKRGAEKLNITEEEFIKEMSAEGYKIPTPA